MYFMKKGEKRKIFFPLKIHCANLLTICSINCYKPQIFANHSFFARDHGLRTKANSLILCDPNPDLNPK